MDTREIKNKKIVCLGGGIGTVNLIKGLKDYSNDVSVIVSMADEGGSSGRLRRLYDIFPPGDLVSCMAALSSSENSIISRLLTYRFPGDRYAKEEHLSGHKMGNLLMVALRDICGDFDSAIAVFKEIFKVSGNFFPATSEPVTISAQTIDGLMVHGEEAIDLGKYSGKPILEKVFINPENPQVPTGAIDAIKNAQVIIAGPGDLYTTILPVLIIPQIADALKASTSVKIFVVNVANKPFETKGYLVSDFISAITKHLEVFPFDKVIVNNNYHEVIPQKFHYDYVKKGDISISPNITIVEENLIDEEFPLYHSSAKLAKVIAENI